MRGRNTGRGVLAACAAGLLALGSLEAPAQAAGLSMALSSVSGPSGGGNTITATVASSAAVPSPFAAGTQPMVQFQYSGAGSTQCTGAPRPVTQIAGAGTATTAGVLTVDPDDVQRVSGTRLAFTVPSASYPAQVDGQPSSINTTGLALAANQTSSKWLVCLYDPGNALIAAAPYTLAVRPRITSIIPASSPAFGGQTITVNGVGFNPASGSTTASIGGLALKDVRVTTSGTSLTGTTVAHTPGNGMSLLVSTTGGSVSSADPDNNGLPEDSDVATPDTPLLFSYVNGISITPTAAQAGTKANIDIKGTSFDGLTFSRTAAPTDPTAHVFLVRDAYSPSSNRGVQECKNVKLINSSELVCTLDLGADRLSPADSSVVTGTPVAEGTYTITVVSNGSPAATDDVAAASVVSTGATFTVAAF
jgi:IPT/TIG domain